MMNKIPLTLVTGFLGSGKTSFLQNYLSCQETAGRIAVIQNEFADSGIDGEILKDDQYNLILKELRKGSIFCRCLFSSFLDTLKGLSSEKEIDAVFIEATGIADPIAIAQVFEDEEIQKKYYLERIITVVDAVRFMDVMRHILAVRHQIEVADIVLVNKTDLASENQLSAIKGCLQELNPMAQVMMGSYGCFDPTQLVLPEVLTCAGMRGELTRCGDGNYVSSIFRSSNRIVEEKLMFFLDSLDERVLRLKGFVTCEENKSYMVQYVPGQLELRPTSLKVGKVELISIGYVEPDFSLLS